MSLKEILQGSRKAIGERWLDLVLADYAPDTSRFLRNKRDQFANPVGHTLIQGLSVLLDGLIEGRDDEQVAATLEDVIRIRAVQELPPSIGAGFLQSLKVAVEKEVGRRLGPELLRAFDQRVDELLLRAFDVYMAQRARLFEIRLDDLRRSHLDVREQVALRKARQGGAAQEGASQEGAAQEGGPQEGGPQEGGPREGQGSDDENE